MARGIRIKGLTISTLRPLIAEHRGNLAAVARALAVLHTQSVSRSAVSEFVNSTPELKQWAQDARDAVLDDVETAIEEKALNGDVTAQIFILKTRGRGRGYSERTELTGAEGEALLPPVIRVLLGHKTDDSA